MVVTRRSLLVLLASSMSGKLTWPDTFRRRVLRYLEAHRRPEGAYGWSSDYMAQLTPTFGAIGSYRLLNEPVPEPGRVAAFVLENYPAQPARRWEDRPMWRLDFEQVQTLLWLDHSIESFREPASQWTAPSVLTPRYELNREPVLQNQAMAVHIRFLLKLSPSEKDGAWREYFLARRRADGTFNNTPASDGSGGHVMNTRWGLMAAEHLGLKLPPAPGLAEWVQSCQLPSGGFTWSPSPNLGAVDDLAYTWCALQILHQLNALPLNSSRCGDWIESLQTSEGGFQDRPDGEPNPLATYYALSCLQLLNHVPKGSVKPAPRARRVALTEGLGVFGIQIEAPGLGSPRDAVFLAKTLGIDLWAAKNCPEGWVAQAQNVAADQKVPVTFAIGDEEHNSYIGVPGLGYYSHLVDMHAPVNTDSGQPVPKKSHPYKFEEFRELRLRSLMNGKGRLVWQCNDNEELSRILLDEAVATGAWAAIASFHFGRQDFAHTYPFLHRWYGRLPFTGLLDAHTSESWWWGDQLGGQKTLFLAKAPTWDGWLEALRNQWIVSVRHDEATNWKTHLTGGNPAVREFVRKHESKWRWWDDNGKPARRPAGSLVLLRAGMPFEAGAPAASAVNELALRLRLWHDNTQQGRPAEARSELVALKVDGKTVTPEERFSQTDRYYLVPLRKTSGTHRAQAEIRILQSGRIEACDTTWTD